MDWLVKIYKEFRQNFSFFLHLFSKVKKEGWNNKQDIAIEILQNRNKLKDLGEEIEFYHNRISELKSRKSVLE